MEAETILVIILSSFLAIFLILAIAAMVLVIKLIKSLKHIIAKAEDVVDSVEIATDVLKNASGPLATMKALKNIVQIVKNSK